MQQQNICDHAVQPLQQAVTTALNLSINPCNIIMQITAGAPLKTTLTYTCTSCAEVHAKL
jgi:hypothetical protein